MPSYKYIYFNARGRGELPRYIFALSGLEYEDKRVELPDWPVLKPDMPFRHLPVLEVDGTKISEGQSIARFLAKETGLAGRSNLEQAMVDSVADYLADLRDKILPLYFMKGEEKMYSVADYVMDLYFMDEEEKKQKLGELIEKTAPATLGNLEKFLSANSGGDGFFVGDSITYADLSLYAVLENMAPLGVIVKDVLKDYPKLSALHRRVGDNPKIAAYIQDRPDTIM